MQKHMIRFAEMLPAIKKKYRRCTNVRKGEICNGVIVVTVGEKYLTQVEECWKWNTVSKFPTINARCTTCEKIGMTWEFRPDNLPSDIRITDVAWNDGPCDKRTDGSYVYEIPF